MGLFILTLVTAWICCVSAKPEVLQEGFQLHQGDMLLTEKQMKQYDASEAAFAGSGVQKDDIWPKGVIA